MHSSSMRLPRQDDGDEALARRAAAGDGDAFATLYDRYERRAYNLCYRITGSAEDAADATQETFMAVLERLPRLEGRELNFGSYLLTAARNASYDVIARRKRVRPAGDIADSAVPVGAGGDDPERPERHALRAAHQEQIRAANESLPPRQREVLALRELEELSYDDVAQVMGMNRNAVAQLISRARINLRDNLRQTALGSVAPASPLCERALPLLALRQDDALEEEPSAWLAEHLAGCGTCRVRMEAMEEAGVAYRLWLPLVPALWLRGEATAHAAERVGAGWNAPAPRRGRHLRLAAAVGTLLVIAFVLAAVDRAQTPTRTFPVPVAAPVETAPTAVKADKPVAKAVVRRAPKRRPPKLRVKRAPVEREPVLAAVTETSPPPVEAAPAERASRPAPERRRRPSKPQEPTPEPVVADDPPDPVAPPPPPEQEVPQTPEPPAPLCPGPNCPGGGSATVPPCPTATTAAVCPPPKPPGPVTCTRCEVIAPRPQPEPPRTITTRPSTP
jgi:RNA polymerase sigma factor (sigma-70 family)